ncbi:prepilin peptidase [uncultured Corynebacterium sp.]|uniref:prepilin peptidase n=1 Tax=uncultured Corynebacterium sp. TaxID=159447 RepID=UPI0025DDB33C|nr:prepilin peptidase [uncultured Corynebacterium sp.]
MWGGVWDLLWTSVALTWSVALTVTDLRERRLPDALTLPAVAVVWVWCVFHAHLWALTGALAWWVLCTLPGTLGPRLRIGGGDAKLALSLGAAAAVAGGPVGWWVAVTASSLITLLFAVPSRRVDESRRPGLPHGPGMLVGTWLSIFLTM